MSSPPSKSSQNRDSLYPEVPLSSPETTPMSSASSSLYPSLDMDDAPEEFDSVARDEVLIRIPGATVHLIERDTPSVELACGELTIVNLIQDQNSIAVFARIGDQIQWPLAKDEPAVKLDDSHYFFTLRVPSTHLNDEEHEKEAPQNLDPHPSPEVLNYGLTIAAKGQEGLLKEFDSILERYSCFSVKEVKEAGTWGTMDPREVSPAEVAEEEGKRESFLSGSGVYWTALAPNVEDYSGRVARAIAAGSGQVVKGILWCGDVTVARLRWAKEFLSKRSGPGTVSEISPAAMRRVKRAKKLTEMSEKVANKFLSGVVKVSGFFTSSIVNSKIGRKFFSLMPGEIILASLEGFSKVCDAVEVAGRNVMSTTSVVTTKLVTQRYGEQAAEVTNEGLDAAGHAMGAAWAMFKIRKALDPKSVIKPTTLAKAAAKSNSAQIKSKESTN